MVKMRKLVFKPDLMGRANCMILHCRPWSFQNPGFHTSTFMKSKFIRSKCASCAPRKWKAEESRDGSLDQLRPKLRTDFFEADLLDAIHLRKHSCIHHQNLSTSSSTPSHHLVLPSSTPSPFLESFIAFKMLSSRLMRSVSRLPAPVTEHMTIC